MHVQSQRFSPVIQLKPQTGKNIQYAPKLSEPQFQGTERRGIPKVFLAFALAVFGGFVAITGTIANKFYQAYQHGKAEQTEVLKTAIGTISPYMGPDIAITPDHRIVSMGATFASFKANGESYTYDGRLIGHADENGNMYTALFPDKPWGHVNDDGTIEITGPSLIKNAGTIHANNLSKQEKAAAAVAIFFHPDNLKK
jgi:hypothetical protein